MLYLNIILRFFLVFILYFKEVCDIESKVLWRPLFIGDLQNHFLSETSETMHVLHQNIKNIIFYKVCYMNSAISLKIQKIMYVLQARHSFAQPMFCNVQSCNVFLAKHILPPSQPFIYTFLFGMSHPFYISKFIKYSKIL